MNGSVDRLLEAIRQRALVRSGRLYGQVECQSRYHWLLDIPETSCTRCGAAL